MARLRTIDGYGCEWHDDNEPDGSCTCLFKCDSCGTEYRQGDHPAKKCVVELTRQLAEARKLLREWRNLAYDDPQWKYDDLFERTDTFNPPAPEVKP